MHKKQTLTMILGLVLALILNVVLPLPTAGAHGGNHLKPTIYDCANVYYTVDVSASQYSIEEQFDRLRELMIILQSPYRSLIAPFDASGEPLHIPNISLIIPPDTEGESFIIGLEINYEGIAFDDDAMRELTLQTPPEEVAKFILSFAGIPYSMAEVGFVIIQDIPLLPMDYIITDICPIWGDERNTPSDEYNIDAAYARNVPVRMGQLVGIAGRVGGVATIGHPFSASNSSRFFTSTHLNLNPASPGDTVYLGGIPIGHLRSSVYAPMIDVAVVDTFSISHELPTGVLWPSGNRVTFRNTPTPRYTQVISLNGVTGMQPSTVFGTNALTGSMTNKIIIFETPIARGDSGAALIRLHDSAVIGTLRASILFQGVRFLVYSCIQNYTPPRHQWLL